MPVPSWLSTDTEPPKTGARTRPGWAPRPNQKVKLVSAWAVPESGAGQDEGPPTRDDWWNDPAMNPAVTAPAPQAPVTPDSLTVPGSDATVSAGPGPSTLAPSPRRTGATPAPPARSVLPSSGTAPVTAPATRAGISNGASAPPPQGSSSRASLGSNQQAFLQSTVPLAMTESERSGIPWQVYVGIAANETGWGGSTLATQQHNYFSIKGKGPAGSTSLNAWEVVNGQNTTQQSDFRAYTDPQQSFADFTDFLHQNPRYQPALDYLGQHPNDWRTFVRMLNDAGYATDPNWADKVISIGGDLDPNTTYPSTPVTHAANQSGGVPSVLSVGSSAIGQRYQFGGAGGRGQSAASTPTDCSGFVSWAYEQATGIRLPAQTQGIYASTMAISPQDAQPGDLVMFNMGQGDRLEHVGIYAGNGQMLHDSSINPNGGVDLTPIWGGAEFRRVPGVDPSLRQPAPNLWGGQGSQAQIQSWSIVVHGGHQWFYGQGSGGSPTVQDMGPAPEGRSNGDVIDTSANYPDQNQSMGTGQDDDPAYDIPVVGGLRRAAEEGVDPLKQATNQLDPTKRQYPLVGPTGQLGIYDPRIQPQGESGDFSPDTGEAGKIDVGGTAKSMHPEDPGAYAGGGGGYAAGLYPDAASLSRVTDPTSGGLFSYVGQPGDAVVAKVDDLFGEPMYVVKNTHSSGDTQYLFVDKSGDIQWKYFDDGSGPPTEADAQQKYLNAIQNSQTYKLNTKSSKTLTGSVNSAPINPVTPGATNAPAQTSGPAPAVPHGPPAPGGDPTHPPEPFGPAGPLGPVGNQPPPRPNAGASGYWAPPPTVTNADVVQAFEDYSADRINQKQLNDQLSGGTSSWVDPQDVQQYALEQARQGDPSMLQSLQKAVIHQFRYSRTDEPETIAFRTRLRMGRDQLQAGSPYHVAERWEPTGEAVGDGNDSAKGEVHARGLYLDTDPNQASRRYSNDPKTYAQLWSIDNLDRERVLDLVNDPNAEKVIQDAHAKARTQFSVLTARTKANDPYPDFGKVLSDVLRADGYQAVFGGGLHGENGELVILEEDLSQIGHLVDEGQFGPLSSKMVNLPKWSPGVAGGVVLGAYYQSQQGQPTQTVQDQGMGMGAGLGQDDPVPEWQDDGNPEDRDPPTGERLVTSNPVLPRPDLTPKLDGGDLYPWTQRVPPPRVRVDPMTTEAGGAVSPDTTYSQDYTPWLDMRDDSQPYMPSRMPNYVPQPQDPDAPIPVGSGAEAAPKPTMSKKEASYTKRATEDHCGGCSMFRSNKCTLVKGYIHTRGSCDYFEPARSKVGAGNMGAGDDWYNDPSVNVDQGNLELPDDQADRQSAAALDKVLATPGMGYTVPTTADAQAYLNRKQAAQTATNQAALTAQRHGEQDAYPAPPPKPTVPPLSPATAPPDLSGLPQDPTRHALAPPQNQPPSDMPGSQFVPRGTPSAPPRRALPPPTGNLLPMPDDAAARRAAAPSGGVQPAQPATPVSALGQQTGMVPLGEAGQRQARTQPATDNPPPPIPDPRPVLGAAWRGVQDASTLAATVLPYLNPVHDLSLAAHGTFDAARYVVSNFPQAAGDVDRATQKFLTPERGSTTERVIQKAVNGQQMTPVEAAQFGMEYSQKAQDFRADLVRATQPPEMRGTPQGEAMANGLALMTDPMNLVGLPEVGLGKKLLTEGAAELAPKAVAAVEHLTYADARSAAVMRGLNGPMAAHDQIRVLQQAALDLNDAHLLDDANALKGVGSANRKWEPLSGEQVRRTLLRAVARSDPKAGAAAWNERVDGMLSRAGLEHLTTESLFHATPEAQGAANFAASQWGKLPEEMEAMAAENVSRSTTRPDRTLTLADVGRNIGREPARVGVAFAAQAGFGGGAAALAMDRALDPNDPYRNSEIATAGLVGAMAGVGGAHLIGLLAKGTGWLGKAVFAPTTLLNPEYRDMIRTWAGNYVLAATAGQRLEDEMKAAFADLPTGNHWIGLADWIETHNALPLRYKDNKPAQDFLKKWQQVTTWAVQHDIVPNEINFVKAGSKAKQYVPHATAEGTQQAFDVGQEVVKNRPGRMAVNPMDYYNKPRTFETLADGMKAMGGDFYDKNVPRVWGNYLSAAGKRRANQMLVDSLVQTAARNNPSLITPTGLANYILKHEDIFALPAGMGKGDVGPSAMALDSLLPQLRGQNIYASRRLYGVLKNLFQEPSVLDQPVLKQVQQTTALLKHNVLSGSGFHLLNEMKQFQVVMGARDPLQAVLPTNLFKVFHDATLPGTWNRFLSEPQNAALVRGAIRDGLTLNLAMDRPGLSAGTHAATVGLNAVGGAAAGYGAAAQSGASDQERVKAALLGAAFGGATGVRIPHQLTPFLGNESRSLVEHFSNGLWSRVIPAMKLQTYAMYAPKFGGRHAADFANMVFGGQNLMAIARSRTTQDMLSMVMLAPDWQEGWARQVGYAAFDGGPQGTMNRMYWGSAALQSVFWLEGLNLALGGQFSWQNDPDATGLVNLSRLYDATGTPHRDPTTGQPYTPYLDVLGPYRGIFEVFQQTGRWAAASAMKTAGLDPTTTPGYGETVGAFGRVPEPLDPVTTWKNYLSSRIGILPASAMELSSGRDWLGRPLDQPTDTGAQIAVNRVNQAFTHFLPTGESQLVANGVRGDPAPMSVLSALSGMRLRHESATNAYFTYQEQFVRDLGKTKDEWQGRRDEAAGINEKVNSDIEQIQGGLGQWADQSHSAREQAIVRASGARRTTNEDLQQLIDERHLSPEDRATYTAQLEWLKRQSISFSGQGSADINDRPDLDLNEMFRLSWNRDPALIARTKGTAPPPASGAEAVLQDVTTAISHRPGSNGTKDLASVRARWTQETAALWGVDPSVMEDVVKANLYGYPDNKPPALTKSDGTSMTSADLDSVVKNYTTAGEGQPGPLVSQAKQQVIFDYAAQTGVDPQALAQRVKLRQLPMVDNTEAGIERSKAIDLQTSARLVPYVNPDGSPLGGPKEWRDMDNALKAADDKQHHRGGKYWTGPDLLQPDDKLNGYAAAKARAVSERFRDIQQAPTDQRDAWEKWFGEGAQMTDAQYAQYQAGTLDMWTDKPPATEAQQRNKAIISQRGLSPAQRFTYSEAQNQGKIPKLTVTVKDLVTGQMKTEKMNLNEYLLYIGSHKTPRWQTVGVDPMTAPGVP